METQGWKDVSSLALHRMALDGCTEERGLVGGHNEKVEILRIELNEKEERVAQMLQSNAT